MNISLTAIQAWIAPILAPVAPALMFGNNLYNGLLADGMNANLAIWGAFGGTIGVEFSGALACSMAVKAYHNKDTRVMWVSIASAVVYAVFVFAGIARAKNSATFASAVFISLIAYLMLGVYQDYLEKKAEATKRNDEEIKRMDAERRLTNAQTRQMKAGERKVSPENQKVSETFGNDWRHVPAEHRVKIATMTTKQISETYRVSERTALNWQTYAKDETK